MSESERPDRSAPEDALCSEHPDRPALATCPRCGSYACLVCWHTTHDRCQACILRHPEEAAPQIPWEDAAIHPLARLPRTLLTALSPIRSAVSFSRGSTPRAALFALLTILPLALLAGVVPYTHTLRFGPSFEIVILGRADDAEILLDLARAVGLSLGLTIVSLVSLALPYASLVAAYASAPERSSAAMRVLLYRGFLFPLGQILLYLFAWAAPVGTSEDVALLARLVSLIPFFLLLSSMRATARLAAGVGPVAAVVVVLVPFGVFTVIELLTGPLVAPWMPTTPT